VLARETESPGGLLRRQQLLLLSHGHRDLLAFTQQLVDLPGPEVANRIALGRVALEGCCKETRLR
jgi:hypothetical protein